MGSRVNEARKGTYMSPLNGFHAHGEQFVASHVLAGSRYSNGDQTQTARAWQDTDDAKGVCAATARLTERRYSF